MGSLLVFVVISTCSGQTCLAEAFCDLLLERTQNPTASQKGMRGLPPQLIAIHTAVGFGA